MNGGISKIYPTSVVEPGAEIGPGSIVGAYTVIGPNVRIGRNNYIGPHVVIEGYTTLGDNNKIFQFASVGSEPQDLKWRGEITRLEIGDSNIIREYVTLQPGVVQFGGVTLIGSKNLFMASSHVGHDSRIGDGNWITNSVALAGHVTLGNAAIIGGLAAIHQHVRIGDLAYVGGGAMVSQDVPPYCIVQGDRARIRQLNLIGLQRNGFSEAEVRTFKTVFKALFVKAGTMVEKIKFVEENYGDFEPAKKFLDFFRTSKRGVSPFGRSAHSEPSFD